MAMELRVLWKTIPQRQTPLILLWEQEFSHLKSLVPTTGGGPIIFVHIFVLFYSFVYFV